MRVASLLPVIALVHLLASPALAQTSPPATGTGTRSERRAQPRAHGQKIVVDRDKIVVDDGDTAVIQWGPADAESVRILGIDTPETRHVPHDLPYAQAFGAEARGFAQGAFATATKVEIKRASTLDPYGRTLAYFYLNGANYSVLVVRARLAEESVTRYGDNGFPEDAAEVAAAAKAAGPVPFESPGDYRRRMRDVSRWMKSKGLSPEE